MKVSTRIEWENERTNVFVDDDDETLLMTAPGELILDDQELQNSTTQQEDLFDCLQKLVIASMTVGLLGIGVAVVFLMEYFMS